MTVLTTGSVTKGKHSKWYRFFWQIFKKNEVIYYARKPIEYVMFKEIHKYLPSVKIVASKQETKKYLRSQGVPFRSMPGFPKVIIAPQYLRYTFNIPEIKKITIFHGMAKDVMFDPKNFEFDLLLVMGDYAAERFLEKGIKHFQVVGYPKIDGLFNDTINLEFYRNKLNLDPNKKTILYAPTWGENGSLNRLASDISDLGSEYNLLVKLHDKSVDEWSSKLRENRNLHLIEDPDIVPYYKLADLLISDFSSVIFEFAVLDRPIILFESESVLINASKDSIGYNWRDIGIQVADFDTLKAAILRSIKNPSEFSAKRHEYSERLFKFTDGRSAERAAKAIKEFSKFMV